MIVTSCPELHIGLQMNVMRRNDDAVKNFSPQPKEVLV
jgi:hypothetical protein